MDRFAACCCARACGGASRRRAGRRRARCRRADGGTCRDGAVACGDGAVLGVGRGDACRLLGRARRRACGGAGAAAVAAGALRRRAQQCGECLAKPLQLGVTLSLRAATHHLSDVESGLAPPMRAERTQHASLLLWDERGRHAPAWGEARHLARPRDVAVTEGRVKAEAGTLEGRAPLLLRAVDVHLGKDLRIDHGTDQGPHRVEDERRVDKVHGAHELWVGVVELRDVRLQQPEEGSAGVLHAQPGEVEDDGDLVHAPAARVGELSAQGPRRLLVVDALVHEGTDGPRGAELARQDATEPLEDDRVPVSVAPHRARLERGLKVGAARRRGGSGSCQVGDDGGDGRLGAPRERRGEVLDARRVPVLVVHRAPHKAHERVQRHGFEGLCAQPLPHGFADSELGGCEAVPLSGDRRFRGTECQRPLGLPHVARSALSRH